MTTIPDTLPSGIPDFSEAKDFEDEADARVFNEEDEPTSPHDTDNLPPEFRGLEERLQEMRRAPRKPTASTPKEKVDGEEDEPLKALYFVRIPRADTDSPTYDLLQQEFEAQLAQVKIYVEERRVQTMKKNEARKDTNKALACLKEANDRVNEQRSKLDPYRKQKEKDREARTALKNSKRGLAATTERELDDRIRKLEFQMEHATNSLSEEKELHNEIKRLKASRPQVREIERKDAEHAATMMSRDLSPSNREHLEKELKEYRAEQSMYEKMFKDLRANEREVDAQLQQICSQLDAAAKKKDAIYEKLAAARNRHRMRKNEFQRNRAFSRHINELVAEKRIEDAQAECMEQTDALMGILMSKEEYREEYLALWSTKRSNPMAVFEDATAEKKKSTAKPTKKTSSLHANVKVLPGQSLPEAVVANALREASRGAQGKQEKVAKVEKTVIPPPVNKTVAEKPDDQEKPTTKAPTEIEAKPKKLPAHDGFELPAVIADKTKEETAAVKEAGDSHRKEEKEAPRSESLERQRLERIEAQKKKKAEQARKKKIKEEEHKEVETKPRETVVKAVVPPQPKKQQPHSKKQTRSRGTNVLGGKSGAPMPRHGKRKNKTEVERIIHFLKQYPIMVASVIAILCIAIVYAFM